METHAAVCIAADFKSATLPDDCKHPSADVHHEIADTLHISTVRHLRELAHRAPVAGSYRWIVIFAKTYPQITQNALLKTLEDPPETSKILLVVPDIAQLLPTVRSRIHLLDKGPHTNTNVEEDVEHWCQVTAPERLQIIDRLHKQKDASRMSALLNGIIGCLASRNIVVSNTQHKLLSDIVMYSVRSGASKRYLLEALALTVPDSLSRK